MTHRIHVALNDFYRYTYRQSVIQLISSTAGQIFTPAITLFILIVLVMVLGL